MTRMGNGSSAWTRSDQFRWLAQQARREARDYRRGYSTMRDFAGNEYSIPIGLSEQERAAAAQERIVVARRFSGYARAAG